MKKFLPYIFIFVVIIGVFVPIKTTSADPGICYGPNSLGVIVDMKLTQATCALNTTGGYYWAPAGSTSQTPLQQQVTSMQSASQAKASLQAATNAQAGGKCSFSLTSILDTNNIWNCIGAVGALAAYYAILKPAAWIIWFSGILLNFILDMTIVQMKDRIGNMTGINIAWKIIRDILNISFIFLMIYEGIMVIVGRSSIDKVKKFVISIVIASILVNFSLFFTKILIDASNIVTIGFYNSIIASSATTYGVAGNSYEIGGLSIPFMNATGITGIYSNESFGAMAGRVGGNGNLMLFYIFGAILLLILAFTFFAISAMFIIRYITLIVLLMLSPIAYLGSVIPGMGKYSSDWWDSLKGQLLFAPIYMIMTTIVLVLISASGFILDTEKGNLADVVAGNKGGLDAALGLMLNYVIVIGLAITTLTIAKSTATKGSKFIGQATGKLTAFAGGAVMGGAARISRNTLGRTGNNWANDEDLKKKAAEGNIRARIQLAAGSKMAKSTFDARNTSTVGAITGKSGLGIELGKVDAKKQNFAAEQKERVDAAKKKAEMYKPSDAAIDEAKARLKSNEFIEEEKTRREQMEAYYRSPEYRESAEYKEKEKLEKEKTERETAVRSLEGDVAFNKERIQEARDALATTTDEKFKSELNTRIKEFENKMLEKRKRVAEEKDIIKEKVERLNKMKEEQENWMSEEYKDLIATVGGTKKAKDDDVIAKDARVQKIENAYTQRVNSAADQEENASSMWRLAAHVVGTPLNVVGITSAPKTKADRQAIAKAIKGAAKEKKKPKTPKEAVKALKDAGFDVPDFPDEPETTPEAAPTPAPTTPPAPTPAA